MGLLDGTNQQQYYVNNDFGNYQFTSLDDIINQFMMVYVGEDKIIPKAKRLDVAFHAQRALAELSFDTFKSCKAQEITVPASLQMILPQDYVNYTKISWVDSAGIKHLLYPTSKTSNPQTDGIVNSEEEYKLQALGRLFSTTERIVLTGDNKNIVVGMTVSHPYIPLGATVIGTDTTAGVTTIAIGTLFADGTVDSLMTPAQNMTDANLTFGNADGSIVMPERLAKVVTGLVLAQGTSDNLITVPSASDLDDLRVGMTVSDANFPIGTVIEDLSGTTIVVSENTIPGYQTATALTQVMFIDYDVDSTTWTSYKSATPSENQDDYQDDTYWPMDGGRYGLDPQHAQANGSFYIDCMSGKIHFSSNISGKTVILDYISDSLGTDGEMQVHKFAEEAMYKWISHAIMAGRANVPEYQVNRFKKERFAAIRTAKLRLSNIKLEEITQILRGKSKQIKH